MAILIGVGTTTIIILVMYLFGLYTRRNIGWVGLCLIWGSLSYGLVSQVQSYLSEMGISNEAVLVIIAPATHLLFTCLGVFFVIYREKLDNLIDGAVYGIASGLGYATFENINTLFEYFEDDVFSAALHSFSFSLVYATASGILGVAICQYYFRHRVNRITFLLSGLGAGIGYIVLFNFLNANDIGGDNLSVVFGIGGITVVGLYVTGLLRKILIQVGVEKKRADSLLDIVIPIGIELRTEKDLYSLLEKMLLEAKSFCNADAGTLYLYNENRLDFAVVRNDALEITMGGTSGIEISFPSLTLYDDETGTPNHRNVATHSALTGKTVNIADAYASEKFDFSGIKEFDQRTGYLSISLLTIPLKNNEGDLLGVLQLINALDSRKTTIIPFDSNLQQLMESFSSLASAALVGYFQEQRLRDEIQELRIEIDAVKRDKQVSEITDSDYFQQLQRKAKEIRKNK